MIFGWKDALIFFRFPFFSDSFVSNEKLIGRSDNSEENSHKRRIIWL